MNALFTIFIILIVIASILLTGVVLLQAGKGEQFIHVVDAVGAGSHQARHAARRDDERLFLAARVGFYLLLHHGDDALGHAHVAVHDAGLDAFDRVAAQHVAGGFQLDARQLGRLFEQRFGADLKSRSYRAAPCS